MHREARLSGETDRQRTERAERYVKHVWRNPGDRLLENQPDYRENRVLYFRHCSVRGGNSAIDILRKMPSLEYRGSEFFLLIREPPSDITQELAERGRLLI